MPPANHQQPAVAWNAPLGKPVVDPDWVLERKAQAAWAESLGGRLPPVMPDAEAELPKPGVRQRRHTDSSGHQSLPPLPLRRASSTSPGSAGRASPAPSDASASRPPLVWRHVSLPPTRAPSRAASAAPSAVATAYGNGRDGGLPSGCSAARAPSRAASEGSTACLMAEHDLPPSLSLHRQSRGAASYLASTIGFSWCHSFV